MPTNAGTASINLDSHSLLIVPTGHDPGEYFSSINNSGIIHQAGFTLDIPSAYSICGIGSIDDHVTCEGSLTSASQYAINLNNGLNVSGTGNVSLGMNSTIYINDTISGMDGGSIYAFNRSIGSAGTGIFNQTGGLNSGANLYLGCNPGSSGGYLLSGTGSLSSSNEYIGYNSIGTFAHSSGRNSAPNLYLGYNSQANGTYSLSGTGNLSSTSEYIGYSGTGEFTQTGGTNSNVNSFYAGYNLGSSGIYNLSGTGKLSVSSEYIGYSARECSHRPAEQILSHIIYISVIIPDPAALII